jgi:hypothetical protein
MTQNPATSLLFFPDCYGKSCARERRRARHEGGPPVAVVGTPFTVSVTAYSDAKGAPSPRSARRQRRRRARQHDRLGGTATLTARPRRDR